ncbi:flippase [Methanocaldococcus sp.]
MNYRERAIKGVSWNLLSYLLTIPIGYGIRVLYAHELPKEDVGLFYALLDLFSLLAIFRGLGIDHGIVRFIPKYLANNKIEIVKFLIIYGGLLYLIISLIMTLTIILLSPTIIKFYFSKSSVNFDLIYKYFIIMAIGFYFIRGILDFIHGLFQGFQEQKILSLIKFLWIFLVFIISLILIFIFKINSALTPVISYSFYSIILIFILVPILYKKIIINLKTTKSTYDSNLLINLTKYSSFIMISAVGSLVLGYIDGICLNLFKGLNVVADYKNVAMPITNIIIYMSSAFISVLFPMVSELYEKNKKILAYGVEKAYLYIFVIGFPISLILFIFPTVLINILFGSSYLTASPIIKVLSFSALFSSLSGLGFTVLNGIGLVRLSSKIIYIGAFCNLIFNLILIPIFGGVGAGLATLISYFIMCLIQIRFISKFLDYLIISKKIIYVIILGFIDIAIIHLIKFFVSCFNVYFQIFILLFMYFCVYLFGLVTLNIIDIKDIKSLKPPQ